MKEVPSNAVHIWKKDLDPVKSLYATQMRCGVQLPVSRGSYITKHSRKATCLKCLRNSRGFLASRIARDASELEKTIVRVEQVARAARDNARIAKEAKA